MKNAEFKTNLFIVLLRYIVPLEKINTYKTAHLEFLDHCYAENIFITSGPQVPRNGGVILAKCKDKDILQKILSKDPFVINNLATCEILEFIPTKWSNAFGKIW